MLRRLILLACGGALLAATPALATELEDHFYGRGTHAYYSGDPVEAHELLTAAIEEQSDDPRVYYFRGLVYLELGRGEEARMDFQKAAQLEMADSNAFYNVSKALERVQGANRLAIEQYRAKARVAALKRAEKIRAARYEAIRSQEQRVLRRNVDLTPQPVDEKKVPKKRGDVSPFGGDSPFGGSEKPEKKAGANPFGQDNPFGGAAKEMPAKKAPAAADPFAGDDPFGGSAPAKKSPEPKEPEAKKASSGDDPFGGSEPAKKAPEPKEPEAKKAPAGDDPFGDDPFGGSEPAKKSPEPKEPEAKQAPAGDDPFGDDPFGGSEPAKKSPEPKEPEPKKPAPSGGSPFGPGSGSSGSGSPFGAAKPPAIEPPAKVAGGSPVTKPTTSPGPAVAQPVSKGQAIAKAKTANPDDPDPTGHEPAGGNPFVDEPMTAGE